MNIMGRWMDATPKTHPIRKFAGRIAKMAFLVLIGFVLVFVMFLAGCQRRIYYLPSRYAPREPAIVAPDAEIIEYRTGAGVQKAFYIEPAESPGAPPERVWMVFVGNGSLALHWSDIIRNPPDARAGFYLFDYPGYGLNEGSPSRAKINDASLAAVDALAKHFKMTTSELAPRLRLICHSMGTGAGLDLAVRLDPAPKQIVLISPYTSMYKMARLRFGRPLCWMLLDRFDNEKRLEELVARDPRPRVIIVHGDRDQVIPVEMGRELAAAHKGWIDYHELHLIDHVDVIERSKPFWHELMTTELAGTK